MIWLAFLVVAFAGSFFAFGAAVTTIRMLSMALWAALWAALGLALIVLTLGAINLFRRRKA